MTAPAGAVVKLYVDLAASVAPTDVIETESGRRYWVLTVREQQRGKHIGRQHLGCMVLGDDWERIVGRDPVIHRIRWYMRKRRAA